MSKDIFRRPNLLMVTDTAMVKKNGVIYAFEPVVREIIAFSDIFESIEWIGFNYPDRADNPIMVPVPEKVKCILLKRTGGDHLVDKLKVLSHIPKLAWYLIWGLIRHNVVHTRGPSSPALAAILISYFFKNKIWWNKYAGNWVQDNPPFFYGLQIKLLKAASWTKVTINGKWQSQAKHCLSFENPCIVDEKLQGYIKIAESKNFDIPLIFLFVGRMEIEKGAGRFIEAVTFLNENQRNNIKEIILVGDGKDIPKIKRIASTCPVQCNFIKTLNREDLDKYYAKSHILVLPSNASEGFPKVISEAASMGCIPFVSSVSSIQQYIVHFHNGYLIDNLSSESISKCIEELIQDRNKLKEMSIESTKIAYKFTYNSYKKRIKTEILGL